MLFSCSLIFSGPEEEQRLIWQGYGWGRWSPQHARRGQPADQHSSISLTRASEPSATVSLTRPAACSSSPWARRTRLDLSVIQSQFLLKPLDLSIDHLLSDDVDPVLGRLVESQQLCPALLDSEQRSCCLYDWGVIDDWLRSLT